MQTSTTYENTVISTWASTTLSVTQTCHPRIETKPIGQHILNCVCADWLEVLVMCAFCDNDDGCPFTELTMLMYNDYGETRAFFRV